MVLDDRISIKTPYGIVKLIITEGHVQAYLPYNMNFLGFRDKNR